MTVIDGGHSAIAIPRSITESDLDGDIEMSSDNKLINTGATDKNQIKTPKTEPDKIQDGKISVLDSHEIEIAGLEPVNPKTFSNDEVNSKDKMATNSENEDVSKPLISPIKDSKIVINKSKKDTNEEAPGSNEIVQEESKSQEPAAPIPRLVIEQLVLTNFKSYAGKQIVGPFHPSFSAVVGPNGSGKSNVIDSLLFVFGFRASKMRQSKLKELIHNSEQFQNLPFCRVDVHFKKVLDKVDEYGRSYAEDVPDSQLIISRKALKNNSSVYYVNNRTSNFSHVRSLLKGEGIDLDHKRFLILQGEVESIAQMKPKAEKDSDDGLLEYLEDIIGTSKYKASIEEATTNIDELNDICVEKERRFDFVEKSKDELEKPKEEALNFLAQERKFLDKREIYLQLSLKKDKETLESNKQKLDELVQELEQCRKDKTSTTKKVKDLKAKEATIASEFNAIEENISVLKKQHRKMEKDKVTMDEKIKHLENIRKKAVKTLESQTLSLKEGNSTLEISQQNIERYKTEDEDLQRQLDEEKRKLEDIKMSLSDKTKNLSKEMEKLQHELEPWQSKMDKKQGEIDVKKSELEMLQKRLSSFIEEMKDLDQSVEEKNELIQSKIKQISILKQERSHVQSQIDLGEPEVQDASNKLGTMERQLTVARQKVEDAKSRVSNTESRNRVLRALNHLKDTGRLNGFYGRLGDLGIIDDKYDIAVSTGGGSLDDMVVDTVECAQQCISYIRKNGLGFGKFIVLNKLRHFNMNKIQTPENVSRLFDLIEPVDNKFAPAFYSSMYDTLVASDLKMANRVAFGGRRRWRVVTLDGKLVDSSGTMSGGGTSVFRGAMKLRSKHPTGANEISPQQMNFLMTDAQNKERAFAEASAAFQQMKKALDEFKERLPQIDIESSKLEVEISSLMDEGREAKKRLTEMKANEDANDKINAEIENISQNISALKEEKSTTERDCSGLRAQIADIQQKIMDVGGVKLKMQRAKVDSIKQKLEIVSEKSSQDNILITKTRNKITRLKNGITANKEEIKKSEETISDIQKDYADRIKNFENSEERIRQLEAEKTDIIDKKEKVEEEIEAANTEANDLRTKEIRIMGVAEQYKAIVESCQGRIDDAYAKDGKISFRNVRELLGWMNEEELKPYIQDRSLLPKLDSEESSKSDILTLKREVIQMSQQLQSAQVDLDVLYEYTKRYTEYTERKSDLNKSIESRDKAKNDCEALKKRRLDEFMSGFTQISSTLREMYHMITMGGNAELELVDSLDPFSEGILFSVMPPRKSWKNIGNLSGGEKTLSSLALVFALHAYKPTPLYVMDEIDAALDFRNVSIVANYIKGKTKNAQFIVISLRNNMFELAERLVGIYKVNNMTKSVTLDNKDILRMNSAPRKLDENRQDKRSSERKNLQNVGEVQAEST